MQPKPRPKTGLYILAILLIYAVIIFFTVEYCSYKEFYPNANNSMVIQHMKEGMIEYNCKLPCIPKKGASTVGMISMFYLLGAWWIYADNKLNKVDMPGKEFGTASWLVDTDAYSLRYADCEALYSEPGMHESFHMKFLKFKKNILHLKIKIK